MASRSSPIISKPFIDELARLLNMDLSNCSRVVIDATAGEPLRITIVVWGTVSTLSVLQVFEDSDLVVEIRKAND